MLTERNHIRSLTALLVLAVAALAFTGCGASKDEYTADGRLVLNYWEKWTGFEQEAMQAVVDEYNKSQDKVFVRMMSVNNLDRKLLVATAGGDPPDIAGIWAWMIYIYSDKGALLPLDDYVAEAGIRRDSYIPIFYDICTHRDHVWALPSTVASIGLHWNKRLFREAGLDPNKPPRSLAELDAMNEKLTVFELEDGTRKTYAELGKKPDGNYKIVQMGFLPFEPDWYIWSWGYWFDGRLWNGYDKITCNDTGNVAALRWVQDSFMRKYGKAEVDAFFGGFRGVFASSQNAFLSGKVAMVLQGVWMYNFIEKYSAGMEWSACAMPAQRPDQNVVMVEADALAIPKGARHPRESFDFIRFVNTRKASQLLALGHRKFPPLKEVDPDFYRQNPNPCIKVFRAMAESPQAWSIPKTGIWNEYQREYWAVYDKIRMLDMDPQVGMDQVQARMQPKLDRENERLRRRGLIP